MEFITDDATLNALISIFVIVCASHEKKLDKLKATASAEEYSRESEKPNLAL